MAINTLLYVLSHSKAKKSHKLVLLEIANHTNSEGLAWPTPTTLSRKTGLSRQWVIQCISDLILVGELEFVPHGSPQRRHAYRIPECQVSLQYPKRNCKLSHSESVNSVDLESVNNESLYLQNETDDKERWLTHAQAVKIGLTPGSRLYRLATGEAQSEE
jgi:hypothetical protein